MGLNIFISFFYYKRFCPLGQVSGTRVYQVWGVVTRMKKLQKLIIIIIAYE